MITDQGLELLKRLLAMPGPAGDEAAAARLWREYAGGFADRVWGDVRGNSYALVEGSAPGAPRVLLAGHIDEIGVMVTYIDDEGFLSFAGVGGWDVQVLVGQRIRLLGKQGDVIGVVGKMPIHLLKGEDRERASKIEVLWIDIGARDKAEALRLLAQDRPQATAAAVATSQEEVGDFVGARTAAFSFDPQVAIVVDVTFATDHPDSNKKRQGDVSLGGGPVLERGSSNSPVVYDMLLAIAEREQIPYCVAASPSATGTDADAIHLARGGVATAVVSIPNRYMHSPNEMIQLDDVEHAAQLIAAFVRSLTAETDFIPS
jgi:endoglucanase